MRISVYLKQQDHLVDSAQHKVTRTFAALLLARSIARPVGQNAVQLTTDGSWKEVKNRLKGVRVSEDGGRLTETALGLLPPLDWYYPWVSLPEWLLECYRSHEVAA